MQKTWACFWFVWAGLVCAETPAIPELAQAQAEIERIRVLVEAGAAPRVQLERAEAKLADAEDAAFLRKTLYGPDLTEEQAGGMVAAAMRRLERRQLSLADARTMLAEGVLAQTGLTPYLEDLDRARKEVDLAESRARLTRELAEMARLEEEAERAAEESPRESLSAMDRFDGDGSFSPSDLRLVTASFESRFSKPLPISALGETAVHRAMGFDHRNRVDVAVHPDQPEGVWLREYLASRRIPFFAFRRAIPGKATGSHIHIGPSSLRIHRGG
jgi:hypothetical protein